MTTENEATFIGYHRSGPLAPWQPMVRGATYGEALDRLLTAVGVGDCLILPAGQDPGSPSPAPAIRRTPGKRAGGYSHGGT